MNKVNFRKECLEQLKKISTRGSYIKDKLVIKSLYKLISQNNAKTIMLYIPLGIEVNIYPLIMQLRKENKELYVPFMEGKSFRLVKYRLPLEKRYFGIKEPRYSKQKNKKIDIAIIPIVGMDCTCRRIGFGKGMYDRFFEKEIKNISKIVFVARKLCYSGYIVTNARDVGADLVIVP